MQIIEKNIDEVIPYENNPRINDQAVPKVMQSIKDFGFKVPLVIDKDNVIVTGHTRLKAAKKLGYKTVPCVIADDLTEEQIKAFRLADNKVSEFSNWDLDLLEMEINDIIDLDMSVYGFDFNIDEEHEQKEIELKDEQFSIVIDCANEQECNEIYDKLVEEGIECRISTL